MKNQNQRQVSIDQITLSNFLEAGGCLRWNLEGESRWFLWEGAESCLGDEKDQEFSIFTTDFFMDQKKQIKPMRWAQANELEFLHWIQKKMHDQALEHVAESENSRFWQEPRKDLFRQSFELIQQNIQTGKIQKALPIVFSKSLKRLQSIEFLRALKKLNEAPKHLTPYGAWFEQQGFLGATPEILFEVHGEKLKTMALAGTATRDRENHEFMSDGKEMSEHQFVVKNLEESLSVFGIVQTGAVQVLELPSLKHLLTNIEVSLKKHLSWWQLAEALHPTAALGTYPRSEWKWLKNLPEQNERGAFGAPFGIQIPSLGFIALVGIRQVQWGPQEICIGAGCGLVKESIFEREWQELLLKISSVQRILGWS